MPFTHFFQAGEDRGDATKGGERTKNPLPENERGNYISYKDCVSHYNLSIFSLGEREASETAGSAPEATQRDKDGSIVWE